MEELVRKMMALHTAQQQSSLAVIETLQRNTEAQEQRAYQETSSAEQHQPGAAQGNADALSRLHTLWADATASLASFVVVAQEQVPPVPQKGAF
ncbi:hypothetical protein AAFF_G00009290 [Aldrovandia affinis]|uniref:Uncharacterized protein n=1 Tax=Aldrovandia affinis TaxID=143900 RepID=A0AAD7T6F8_9TELE|nr:hypothetical protein AAFF_G00009290 [Aldrovandia affinis]